MSEKRKEQFLTALFNLSEHRAVKDISISEILEQTGSSRRTFYNHFWGKEDLIRYAYEVYIENPLRRMSVSTLHEFFKCFAELLLEKRSFFAQASEASEYIYTQSVFVVEQFLQGRYESLSSRVNHLDYDVLHVYAGGAGTMLIKWLHCEYPVSSDQFAQQMTACIPPNLGYLAK